MFQPPIDSQRKTASRWIGSPLPQLFRFNLLRSRRYGPHAGPQGLKPLRLGHSSARLPFGSARVKASCLGARSRGLTDGKRLQASLR